MNRDIHDLNEDTVCHHHLCNLIHNWSNVVIWFAPEAGAYQQQHK